MKEVILQCLQQNNRFWKKEELKKKLKVKGEEQTVSFLNALNALVEDGSLFFDEKKGYRIFTNELGVAFGEIEINKSGNGFVHTNDGNTIFIEYTDLNGALDGDKVLVNSITFGRRNDYKGEVQKIIKRKTGHVIFEIVGNGCIATLVPYNLNERIQVSINKNQCRNLVDGELILVKVGTEKVYDEFLGEIEQVIGHKDDPGIDLQLIYMNYNVPLAFSSEALKEADMLPTQVSEEERQDRVDLRNKNIITIDCDDTKDRDDAVYVEQLENGNYKLYTSISHISHYIKKDSSLYKEASIRNTSYYPNNTCNPMFPHKVSNGICSLNEGSDRLTRTCEMEFDSNGNLVDYNLYLSVIQSKKACKYSEVNQVLAGKKVPGYEAYVEQLKLMEVLCNILEKAREERNCIDFDLPDMKIITNKDNQIEKIIESGTGKAQRIIENFMLATGTVVATHYSWLPFIYRVHEAPDVDTVKNVIKLLQISGFNIPKYQNIDEKTVKEILDRVGSSEEAKLVRSILLKSMKRARYDVQNIGHFALQLEKYCHFTSPIRRFTDFRIHTLLDELDTLDYSPEAMSALEKELIEIAKNASNTEKLAQIIENEALQMAMAEYMEKHIGEGYDAIITEVYSHGMFVKTNEMISGKVKLENILDDKYRFDFDKKALIGQKTKKRYQIGNKVYVIAKDACKATRTIDFEVVDTKKKVLVKKPQE